MSMKKKHIAFLILISLMVTSLPGQLEYNNDQDYQSIYLKMNISDPSEPIVGSRGNEAVTFINVSKQANIDQFRGNYFAWGDYNNDGYQDLLVNGKRLLRNNGPPNWNFTDITTTVNISYSGSINVGTWGDWNNDGYLDFYAGGGGWTTNNPTTYDVLWRNTGPPNYTFEDYTIIAGNVRDSYPSVASGWGDYDRDGFIDLYVANYENSNLVGWPDTLWHNNGNGTFTNVSQPSGIRAIDSRPGRGVAWCDYNNDGWDDIYISNYRIKGNFLWENQRDGTFINVAPEKNCQGLEHYYSSQGPYYGHTIGSSWADYDNNGLMDVMVANLVHKYVGPGDIRGYICDDSNLYHNNGLPFYNFTDDRLAAGIPTKPIGGSGVYIGDELYSGVAWGDYDNDGDLDFWVPQVYGDLNYAYSYLYRNNNNGTFTDVAQSLGIRVWDTYGSAWCDYNNDGFLDLVTGGKSPFVTGPSAPYEIHLFKNNGNSNNWLKILLSGQESNRAAIGAKVTAKTGSVTQLRQVEGGMGSHGQQNGFVLHFGFDTNITSIDQLIITWPSGSVQRVVNVPVNQQINIIEETSGPRIQSLTASQYEADEGETLTFNAMVSGNVQTYQWDFDNDGVIDWESKTSPGAEYNKLNRTTTFSARLWIWDSNHEYGWTDTTDLITIINNFAPVAGAGLDIEVWEDQNIIFNSSLTTDSPGDIDSLLYNWDFDDDTSSGWIRSLGTEHNYSRYGVYNVGLSVMDNDYAIDTDFLQVTVKNKIPTCEIISNKTVSEDSEISFMVLGNDTPSDLEFLSYQWDFGDGNVSQWIDETTLTHTYTKKGSYIVKCTVRDDDGAQFENFSLATITVYNLDPICWLDEDKIADEDEIVSFHGMASDTISDQPTLRYLWDFADGNASDWLAGGYQNITHAYTQSGFYRAKLIVEDDDGAQCSKVVNITVNNVKPICKPMNEDIKLNEDEPILFNGTGMDTESDVPTLQFSWDFGLPDVPKTPWKPTPEFEFRYNGEGDYTAVLTVRDDDGDTASESVGVKILNVEPKAEFSISDYEGDIAIFEDELVKFDASDTEDTQSDIHTLSYKWDFADGSSVTTGKVQYHRYHASGDYRVQLTVTDDDGYFNSFVKLVNVENVKPTAIIVASAHEVIADQSITFNAFASQDTPSDKKNLSYAWDFGDKNDAKGGIISHQYAELGKYTVKLTVTDDDGIQDDTNFVVYVNKSVVGANGGSGLPPRQGTEDSSLKDESGSIYSTIAIIIILLIILVLILLLYFQKNVFSILIKKDERGEQILQSEIEQPELGPQPQDQSQSTPQPEIETWTTTPDAQLERPEERVVEPKNSETEIDGRIDNEETKDGDVEKPEDN